MTSFVSLLLALVPGAVGRHQAPNILFLMSDEMDGRIVDPTSQVSEAVEMPFLRDFFHEHGTSFVQSYSNSPVCVPSRSSMITGLATDKIEVWGNSRGIASAPNGVLDQACVENWGAEECQQLANRQGHPETVFSALEQLGYNVHFEGKLHFGGGYCNNVSMKVIPGSQWWAAFDKKTVGEWARSVDILLPNEQENHVLKQARDHEFDHGMSYSYADGNIAKRCQDWIAGLPAPSDLTQPFFLYCSINLPHYTFSTNATWLAKVHNVTAPRELPGFPDKWHPYDVAMTVSKGLGGKLDEEDVVRLRRVYYAMCAEADAALSSVWDALVRKGYSLDDTFLVYVSDHGEINMEHRQYGKSSMYEGSTRVPIQLAGPGISKGVLSRNLVSLLDIFPTLLDMGRENNWGRHTQFQGQSLLEVAGAVSTAPQEVRFLPHSAGGRDFVVSQYHYAYGKTGAFMVRSGPWKYITFGHHLRAYSAYPSQLFNVERDPDELNDVARIHRDVVASLDAKLRTVLDPEEVDFRAKKSDLLTFQAEMNRWNVGLRQQMNVGFMGCGLKGDFCLEHLKDWMEQASNQFAVPVPASIQELFLPAAHPVLPKAVAPAAISIRPRSVALKGMTAKAAAQKKAWQEKNRRMHP